MSKHPTILPLYSPIGVPNARAKSVIPAAPLLIREVSVFSLPGVKSVKLMLLRQQYLPINISRANLRRI
jgi:hypothetical protein